MPRLDGGGRQSPKETDTMNESTEAKAYKRMYHKLFHAAAAAQRELMESSIRSQQINLGLQQAQADCEELLLEMTEDEAQAPEQS